MNASHRDDRFNIVLDQLTRHLARDHPPNPDLVAEISAARDFHTLADRGKDIDAMESAMQRTWENLTMQPATTTIPPDSPHAPVSTPAPFIGHQPARRSSVSSLLNGLLAAIVIIGLVLGYRAYNGGDSGPDDRNLAMLTASGTPDATATLPPIKAPDTVLTLPTLEAQGTLESDGSAYNMLPYIPCTTPAITRESAMQRLNIDGPREADLDTTVGEPIDDETQTAVLAIAQQFFSCLAEGKTLSAMNLMSDQYLQEWLFMQVMSLPGGPTKSSIDTLFDRFEQDQVKSESQSDFGYPEDAIVYDLIAFDSRGNFLSPVKTADGRVHLGFTFASVYGRNSVPSPEMIGMQPREIVLIYEGYGWRVDALKHGNDAYFDDPF